MTISQMPKKIINVIIGNIILLIVRRVMNVMPPYTMTVQQSHHMQVD